MLIKNIADYFTHTHWTTVFTTMTIGNAGNTARKPTLIPTLNSVAVAEGDPVLLVPLSDSLIDSISQSR
jgi:hypothetical protein